MPLVLASSEVTASGHTYEDITGISYEYPHMYRSLVREGERFVYYLGTRRAGGNRGVPVYFGTGVIGEIRPSANPEYLVCAILDYQPFSSPVSFKDTVGQPLEPGGVAGGRYYQRGVRLLPEIIFNVILRVAASESVSSDETSSGFHQRQRDGVYASAAVARSVDEFAMRIALQWVRANFPDYEVTPQAHNNPGYDILVGTIESPQRYIEVKGSLAPSPRFFLTEGERLFSCVHASEFTLLVVYRIDLETGDHQLFTWEGVITNEAFEMSTLQWRCALIVPSSLNKHE